MRYAGAQRCLLLLLLLQGLGLALVGRVVAGLGDGEGGIEQGTGLEQRARPLGLGDGGAEEGGDVVVAVGDGSVEGRVLASRDGGVGTRVEEELHNGEVAVVGGEGEGRIESG